MIDNILYIKVGALRSLCKTVVRYNVPDAGQRICEGLETTLKHYANEELFPIAPKVYETLLYANKITG